jgi:hypothetical protein
VVLAVSTAEPPDDWAGGISGAIRWVRQRGAPPATVFTGETASLVEAVDVSVAGPPRLVQARLPNLLSAVINVSSRLGSDPGAVPWRVRRAIDQRVDYELTGSGRRRLTPIAAIRRRTEENINDIEQACRST